jgi:signal transduction histidine kinase
MTFPGIPSLVIQSSLHQIQTSAGIIRGYFDLFCLDSSRENKEALGEEIYYLSRLLEKLSQFYDPSKDPASKENKEVDMGKFLRGLFQTFQKQNKTHTFSLAAEEIPEKFCIATDTFFLEECLRALLENAFKHTPQKGEIVLGAKKEKDKVVIFVRNSGVGIPQELHQSIFEPFFQIKKDYKSPGLGLSIAKKFAEIQNHSLGIDSDGKNYVRFSLSIPSSFFL